MTEGGLRSDTQQPLAAAGEIRASLINAFFIYLFIHFGRLDADLQRQRLAARGRAEPQFLSKARHEPNTSHYTQVFRAFYIDIYICTIFQNMVAKMFFFPPS